MELVLRKYGNSTVLAFPPGVLKDLGLKAGQALVMDSSVAGKIILTPKRRYSLAQLLAQCDANAPPPADLAAGGAKKIERVPVEVMEDAIARLGALLEEE